MLLYIVRHGETEENARGVLQGRTPGKLNSTGIEQARLTGLALRNKGITAIHSSNLDRALDSALIISDIIGAVLVPEKNLQERNLGILEGKTWEKYFEAQADSGLSHTEYKPDGGESIIEMQKRLKPVLEEITGQRQRGDLLIVGHGGLNTVILDMLLPMPLGEIWDKGQKNGCINSLNVLGPMEAELLTINDTAHLASLKDEIESTENS